MNYKKLFLIGLISAFIGIAMSPLVSASELITDMNTNTPVPLGEFLTVSGIYNNTDSNASVFCKFQTKFNGIIVERFSDELTFANGEFYSQRKITEPKYKRDNFYTVSVSCNNATADTNFSVGQRETIAHVVEQETLFAFERGNLDVIFFFGAIFIILIVFVLAYLVAVGFTKKGFNK